MKKLIIPCFIILLPIALMFWVLYRVAELQQKINQGEYDNALYPTENECIQEWPSGHCKQVFVPIYHQFPNSKPK